MRRHAAAALGAAGLLVVVVGTFLPWLRSGSAQRNSYRAGSALRRLVNVSGWQATGLDVWPYVGLWCAAVIAAYVLGYRAVGVAGSALAGGASLAVGIGALTADGNGFVAPATPGPVVTIVGACLVLVAVTLWLLPARQDAPSGRERHEPATDER